MNKKLTKAQVRKLVRVHGKTHGLKKESISHFARYHSIHPTTISKWLSGERKRLSDDTMTTLAVVGNVRYPSRGAA